MAKGPDIDNRYGTQKRNVETEERTTRSDATGVHGRAQPHPVGEGRGGGLWVRQDPPLATGIDPIGSTRRHTPETRTTLRFRPCALTPRARRGALQPFQPVPCSVSRREPQQPVGEGGGGGEGVDTHREAQTHHGRNNRPRTRQRRRQLQCAGCFCCSCCCD